MQNRQNPDKWNLKMKSGKRLYILLRSIIALLTIIIILFGIVKYSAGEVYITYPRLNGVPYELRGFYPDLTGRFLIEDNAAYFPQPSIKLNPQGDWFINPLSPIKLPNTIDYSSPPSMPPTDRVTFIMNDYNYQTYNFDSATGNLTAGPAITVKSDFTYPTQGDTLNRQFIKSGKGTIRLHNMTNDVRTIDTNGIPNGTSTFPGGIIVKGGILETGMPILFESTFDSGTIDDGTNPYSIERNTSLTSGGDSYSITTDVYISQGVTPYGYYSDRDYSYHYYSYDYSFTDTYDNYFNMTTRFNAVIGNDYRTEWKHAGNLYVGNAGQWGDNVITQDALFTISNGGLATIASYTYESPSYTGFYYSSDYEYTTTYHDLFIGKGYDGTTKTDTVGRVLVDGKGSALTAGGLLMEGIVSGGGDYFTLSTSSLDISYGATAQFTEDVRVATEAGSKGIINVVGAGSILTTQDIGTTGPTISYADLTLGSVSGSFGILNLLDGGRAEIGSLNISGGQSTITIAGSGATLKAHGSVGLNGTIAVSNGGALEASLIDVNNTHSLSLYSGGNVVANLMYIEDNSTVTSLQSNLSIRDRLNVALSGDTGRINLLHATSAYAQTLGTTGALSLTNVAGKDTWLHTGTANIGNATNGNTVALVNVSDQAGFAATNNINIHSYYLDISRNPHDNTYVLPVLNVAGAGSKVRSHIIDIRGANSVFNLARGSSADVTGSIDLTSHHYISSNFYTNYHSYATMNLSGANVTSGNIDLTQYARLNASEESSITLTHAPITAATEEEEGEGEGEGGGEGEGEEEESVVSEPTKKGLLINNASEVNLVNSLEKIPRGTNVGEVDRSSLNFNNGANLYVGVSGNEYYNDGILNLLNSKIDGNGAFGVTIGSANSYGRVNIFGGKYNLHGGNMNIVNGYFNAVENTRGEAGTITVGTIGFARIGGQVGMTNTAVVDGVGLNHFVVETNPYDEFTTAYTNGSKLLVLSGGIIRSTEAFSTIDGLIGGNGTIRANARRDKDGNLVGPGYRTILEGKSVIYAGDYKGEVGTLTFAGQLDLGPSPYFRVDLRDKATTANSSDRVNVTDSAGLSGYTVYAYADVRIGGAITVDLTSLIQAIPSSISSSTILQITGSGNFLTNLPTASNTYASARNILDYEQMNNWGWSFRLNGEVIPIEPVWANDAFQGWWTSRVRRTDIWNFFGHPDIGKTGDSIYGHITANALEITLNNLVYENHVLTWRGYTDSDASLTVYAAEGANLNWNLTVKNWMGTYEGDPTNPLDPLYGATAQQIANAGTGRFLDGDAVIFDYNITDAWFWANNIGAVDGRNPANFQIIIGGNGKTVAEMVVRNIQQSGSDPFWIPTFVGNILADGTKTTLTETNNNYSGQLQVTNSRIRLAGNNEFRGGIKLQDSTIILRNGDDFALGSYGGATLTKGVVQILSDPDVTRPHIEIYYNHGHDDVAISNRFYASGTDNDFRIYIRTDANTGTYFVSKLTIENVRGGGSAIDLRNGSNLDFMTSNRDFAMRNNNSKARQLYDIKSMIAPYPVLSYSNDGDGGAIYINGGTITGMNSLRNFILSNNEADNNGGGMYLTNSLVFDSYYTTFLFENNIAGNNGGAIWAGNNDLTFTGNSGKSIEFVGNHADGTPGLTTGGGAIYARKVIIAGAAMNFSGNTAASNGGAIFTPTFDFQSGRVTFNGNIAGRNGGALYVVNPTSGLTWNLLPTTSYQSNEYLIFTGNESDFQSDIDANVNGGGGAIYTNYNLNIAAGNFNKISSNFIGNKANNGSGGAIYIDSDGRPATNPGQVILSGSNQFSSNFAKEYGGAIYSDWLVIGYKNLSYSTILNYDFNDAAKIDASNTSFLNNRVGIGGADYGNGGAFYGNFLIAAGNTSFIDNESLGDGGAAYITKDGYVVLNASAATGDIAFANNKSKVKGSNSTPNSLFLETGINIFLTGERNIYFDDPIASYKYDPAAANPILPSSDGGNTLSKAGSGFVQFVGENILNPYNAATLGNVDIYAGTFRLAGSHPSLLSSFTTNGDINFGKPTTTIMPGNPTKLEAGDIILSGQGKFKATNINIGDAGYLNNILISPDNDKFEIPGGVGFAGATPGRNTVTYARSNPSIGITNPNSKPQSYYKAIGKLTFDADVKFNFGIIGYKKDESNNLILDGEGNPIPIYKNNQIKYKVDLADEYVLEEMPKLLDKTKELFNTHAINEYKKTVYTDDVNSKLLPRIDLEFKQSDDIIITGDITAPNRKIVVELNNWVEGTFELMRSYKDDGKLDINWFKDISGNTATTLLAPISSEFGIEVTVAGLPLGSRQVAYLYVENDVKDVVEAIDYAGNKYQKNLGNDDTVGGTYNRLILVANTAYGNKDLLWTGVKSNNQWNTTDANWRWYWTTDIEKYNPNDYVIFDGIGLDRSSITINNKVQVSGMLIMGGWQSFVREGAEKEFDMENENIITGKLLRKKIRTLNDTYNTNNNNYVYDEWNDKFGVTTSLTYDDAWLIDNNGQTVSGRLNIDTPTKQSFTEFHVSTSFEKGTQIHDTGTIILGVNNALGKLTNTLEDADFDPDSYKAVAAAINNHNLQENANPTGANPIVTHESPMDLLSELRIASDRNDQSGMVYFYDLPKNLASNDEDDYYLYDYLYDAPVPVQRTTLIKTADKKQLATNNWFYVAPELIDFGAPFDPSDPTRANPNDPNSSGVYYEPPYNYEVLNQITYNLTLAAGADGAKWTIEGNNGDAASQKARWDLQARQEKYNNTNAYPNKSFKYHDQTGPYNNAEFFNLEWNEVYAGVIFAGSSSELNIKGNLSFLNNLAPVDDQGRPYGAIHLNSHFNDAYYNAVVKNTPTTNPDYQNIIDAIDNEFYASIQNVLHFDTSDGDVVLRGNHYIDPVSGEEKPLAISFRNQNLIKFTGEHIKNVIKDPGYVGDYIFHVFLDDPIRAINPDIFETIIDPNDPNQVKELEVWKDSAALLVNFKNTDSFVQLRGVNITHGNITAESGILRLANDYDDVTSSIDLGKTNKLFIGNKAALAGNGIITAGTTEIVGIISPDSAVLAPDDRSVGNKNDALRHVGTLTFNGNLVFYDAEFHIDIAENGNGKVVADKIVVNGNISFGNDEMQINTIKLDDWIGPAKYVIMEVNGANNRISQVDDSWIIKYHGASLHYIDVNIDEEIELDYVSVNSENDEYELASAANVALAVIGQKKLILQLRSDTPFGNVIEWKDGDDWSIDNIKSDNLIVLNNDTPQEIFTVTSDKMLLGGLEVYDKDFELRSITRDNIGQINIVANSKFAGLTANGKIYVHSGGSLYTNVPIFNQYGIILENHGASGGGGTIIYGVQDAFGKYQETYQNEPNSAGRITAIGANNFIKVDASVNATNRIVVDPGAELTIKVNNGETFTISGVKSTANGAAISVTDGGKLTIGGNTIITGNTSHYYIEQIPTVDAGSLTPLSKPLETLSGYGGAIYLEDAAQLIFDTTDGAIKIFNNFDKTGQNGITLVGVDNIVKFEGGKNGNGVDIIDPVTIAYYANPNDPTELVQASGENYFEINFADNPNAFVQFTSAELGRGTHFYVNSGTLRLAGGVGANGKESKVGIGAKEKFTTDAGQPVYEFCGRGYMIVNENGKIAGNGTIGAYYIELNGAEVSPDNEKFTTTSSIIGNENLIGKITLDATADYSTDPTADNANHLVYLIDIKNTTFNIDVKKGNVSDQVLLAHYAGFNYASKDGVYNITDLGVLENNTININAWNTGLFTVLKSEGVADNVGLGTDSFPPDILERFNLELGGDVTGSRQNAKLLFGSGQYGSEGTLIDDYTTLRVDISMNAADRRRIVWSSDANGFLTTSAKGNWLDDKGNDENFNHSDYLIFNEKGKQNGFNLNLDINQDGKIDANDDKIILGKPIYDASGVKITGIKEGARTFSGLLISGGNYTFAGGDFFGVAADFIDQSGQKTTMNGDVKIAAGNVTFENNLYTEGNIEILNAAKVTLKNHKAFHAEKTFKVANTATLIIEPASNLIRAATVDIQGNVKFINEPEPSQTNKPRFDNLIAVTDKPFDAQTQENLKSKFEQTAGLWNRRVEFNAAANAMDLVYSAVSLNDYAKLHNFNANNTTLANYFSNVFNHWEQPEFEKSLMNLNDDQLLEVFSTLSNAAVHSEAKYMALSNPFNAISNHFFSVQDVDNYSYNYSVLRGAPRNAKRDIWFSINNHNLEMKSDGNAQNIETNTSGFNIGADKQYGNALLAGILLATGNAKLSQPQNGNKIEMENLIFGIYLQYQFINEIQLNTYIGFGTQKYDSKRYALQNIDAATYAHAYGYSKTEYDGDSAFWNIELVRPIHWRPGIAFMPAVAVDARYAHTNSFDENDYFKTHIKSAAIDQIMFRAGLNSLWKINDRFRLETQSWYSRQIGGNDTIATNMSIPGANITPANLKGIKAGRDFATLGVGSRYYLTNKKQSQIFLDYVFERGNRSKAHAVNIGYNRSY
ncbi:MAG: hypothetical protein LBP59_04985 [Planctomycetaceae bacterium]|jgi:predicted outer membrane repeat protein|nr:hypothetical protein [Planctomycetaceae bacterium]